MRISDWSSDVCSSDLSAFPPLPAHRRLKIFSGVHPETPPCPYRAHRQPAPAPCEKPFGAPAKPAAPARMRQPSKQNRKSVENGRSVSVRVDLGGGRVSTTKKVQIQNK